jgi:selenide,water dikinase
VSSPDAGDVLVSNDFSDDAAVVRLDASGERGLVMTADIIAPLVDDAEAFGEIAATNSISDVFAMGGRPLYALNLMFFPNDRLPLSVMHAILRGGARACQRMGVAIIGGHTIADADIKYGLSVVGDVEVDAILSNRRARAGQSLVISKPLGTGVIGTAIKQGHASAAEISSAIASMTLDNGGALTIARKYGVTACTDVTGFGLLGHLRAILRGSDLAATVDMAALPLLPGAIAHARAGRIPGGSKNNLDFLASDLRMSGEEDPLLTQLSADAQTSGGLLLCVAADQAEPLALALGAAGMSAAVVGSLRTPVGDESVGSIELRFSSVENHHQ